MKGSLIILGFFLSGVLLGRLDVIPRADQAGDLASWALYMLLFVVGMGIGFDTRSFRILRELHVKVALVPLFVGIGTLGGSLAAWALLGDMPLRDVLGVGAGFGYYSLSSIMITKMGDAALGSMALIANISRELVTLLSAPLLVRRFGGLAPVMAGGATSMDTCLPIIARYAGERYGIIAVFSGMVLTVAVPILVTAIFNWM
ncbi:lysine exporter LysO family protein [Desulfovibrio oxamicus]|uniref:Lysine exporter LysO family protein n=1 Tax=Nitratidesulfovibrio oxamicus TaxID=32016 RepID=A0ABS0J4D5_9BACT|nr:lysine exporter LysO family protein [Nitratidesulfovibrio oxamicus]MBG3877017.1 lysine exporter LysO family protein [Nitratidesulfovibrio oxamicus]